MKAALALALVACTVGSSATAAPPAGQRYQLEAQISGGDAAEARPRLVMAAGEPATIQIANQKYSFRLTATPDAAGNVSIASLVTGWTPAGLAHQDKQAQVRADGTALQLLFPGLPASGSTGDIKVDIRISPVAK
jgi:hypothetical protein